MKHNGNKRNRDKKMEFKLPKGGQVDVTIELLKNGRVGLTVMGDRMILPSYMLSADMAHCALARSTLDTMTHLLRMDEPDMGEENYRFLKDDDAAAADLLWKILAVFGAHWELAVRLARSIDKARDSADDEEEI